MVRLTTAPPLMALLALRGGIDMKWTPNGEAPAPYSTNARQQMGMDPQAMAAMAGGGAPGQAAPAAPGATLQFNLCALVAMYFANNWKIVQALHEFLLKLLAPLLSAMGARREVQQKAAAAEEAAAARRARLARLKSMKAKGASAKAAPADDADDAADDPDEEE